MPALKNAKHERFCQLVALHGANQTEAFAVAVAKPGTKAKALKENASRLAAREDIKARILELGAKAAERAEVVVDATVDRIARELGRVAFLDPRRFFDEKGRLLSVHEMPTEVAAALSSIEVIEKQGAEMVNGVLVDIPLYVKKVRFVNKLGALETLAKWRRMLVDLNEVGKPGEFGLPRGDPAAVAELAERIRAEKAARAARRKAEAEAEPVLAAQTAPAPTTRQ